MAFTPIALHQFDKKFKKYIKKDSALRERVIKRIIEIAENPEIGKPKRHELKGYRSLHVDPFVIFYVIIGDKVVLTYFEHHDKVYKDALEFAPQLLTELRTRLALEDTGISPDSFNDFLEELKKRKR
ncbi:MAG: type II toxin-antitoxin system RelE/ParE family toxin [Methanotrichaceae archaeon]